MRRCRMTRRARGERSPENLRRIVPTSRRMLTIRVRLSWKSRLTVWRLARSTGSLQERQRHTRTRTRRMLQSWMTWQRWNTRRTSYHFVRRGSSQDDAVRLCPYARHRRASPESRLAEVIMTRWRDDDELFAMSLIWKCKRSGSGRHHSPSWREGATKSWQATASTTCRRRTAWFLHRCLAGGGDSIWALASWHCRCIDASRASLQSKACC
mmetsp:Transcript_81205/g.263212  ORF Transcript_81205/g.263212 Transcript_81205/m.263212 type:complete len:211 (-) Transcript_81205:1-633(-)